MGRRKIAWRRDPVILARLIDVERWHLEGLSNVEIAGRLGVEEGTIRNDLKRVRDLWLERIGPTVEELKAGSVASYRQVQAEAWKAFHETSGASLNRSAYLNTVKSSEDSIVGVLGLKAPEKIAPTDPSGEKEYGALGDDERARRIAALLDSARERAARSAASNGADLDAAPGATD